MFKRCALLLSAAACQSPLAAPPTAQTIPPDDGAAFSVAFPPNHASGDEGSAPAPAASNAPSAPPEADAENDAGDDTGPSTQGSADAAPEGACAEGLAPGDLVIDELMIESVAGAGDDGEWLEVRSTRDCAVDVIGLHGECPRGSKVVTFDVTSDLWIPPGGSFIVADSNVPAINHSLPGSLVVWAGRLGDVLRNKGGTVSLRLNGALIDSVTYPAIKLQVGASMAFPSDCDPTARADFTRWQFSTYSWFPGFLGTPNAANDDVHCP